MNKQIAGVAKGALAGVFVLELSGCGAVEPAPRLPASAFVNNQPVIGPGAGQGVDQPGALVYDAEHRPAPKSAPNEEHISDTVRQAVRAPGDEGLGDSAGSDFPPPTSFVPTTQSVAGGTTTGQYQVVGAVIAVVN